MTEAEKLFIRRLNDLYDIIDSSNPHDALEIARILRQLLLDSYPLIHLINREHRLKILFTVAADNNLDNFPPHLPQPEVHFTNPTESPSNNYRQCDLEKFLKIKIVRVREEFFTISDVINFLSNKGGGVHLDKVIEPNEQKLASLKDLKIFDDMGFLYRLMQIIADMVLDAVEDLRDKILGVSEFEEHEGLSIYVAIMLHPIESDPENFVMDIGIHRKKNRVSLFIDSEEHLLVRLINANGKVEMVRIARGPTLYNRIIYLSLEVSTKNNDTLIRVEADRRGRVQRYFSSEYNSSDLQFVLGSDLTGKSHTHMSVYEVIVLSKIPSQETRDNTWAYLQRKILTGEYKSSIYFKDNQHLHSQDHPNFKSDA